MNNRIVIAVIAVLILVGLGFWFFSNRDDNSTGTQQPVTNNEELPVGNDETQVGDETLPSEELEPVTITSTDSGFSPSTITIKLGQRVVFKNNGSVPIEPASDDHPSHKDYSEFDSKNPVPVGGTYEFTFAKRGAWGYHDHLNSSVTGTVVVE